MTTQRTFKGKLTRSQRTKLCAELKAASARVAGYTDEQRRQLEAHARIVAGGAAMNGKAKLVKIVLTTIQADVLLRHWRANLYYGVGGSFGDGDKITHEKDHKIAAVVTRKLERAYYGSLNGKP